MCGSVENLRGGHERSTDGARAGTQICHAFPRQTGYGLLSASTIRGRGGAGIRQLVGKHKLWRWFVKSYATSAPSIPRTSSKGLEDGGHTGSKKSSERRGDDGTQESGVQRHEVNHETIARLAGRPLHKLVLGDLVR